MGGQAKRRRANRKKININPKRARQKLKRRNAPRVACEQLKAVWNEEHTFRRNIEEAGLLYDANKVCIFTAYVYTCDHHDIMKRIS